MYSTCLFCNRPLGRNEALEDFPVGRRLAFDSGKGRLWVICGKCERWNLTPLEERWEAVEQAERHFRGTKQRVSTENIGLTRLADGTELIRIGAPLRPEFAAWRYGDQFGRRRRRRMLLAGGSVGGIATALAFGAGAGMTVVLAGLVGKGIKAVVNGSPEQVVSRIRAADGNMLAIRRRHLAETRLVHGSVAPIAIALRFRNGEARFEGREALRIAAAVMPHVNRYGGRQDVVQSAVGAIESGGGADGYLEKLADHAAVATAVPRTLAGNRKTSQSWSGAFTSGLYGLSAPDRLALEMALHEEAESRLLQGELAELERAWREAEEIAAIADGLLTPLPPARAGSEG